MHSTCAISITARNFSSSSILSKMFHFSLLALLATTALASPLPTSESMPTPRSPLNKPSYITSCEAADNCETYTDPLSGLINIRFKSGMEPGTEDYNARLNDSHTKRQSDSTHTDVVVGDATIYWGCDVDPIATLNNISTICSTEGQCISNAPYTTEVTYVTPPENFGGSQTLTIAAQGHYFKWMRNGIVAGVQTAMSAKGVIKETKVDYGGVGQINKNGPQIQAESCNVAQAPAFIGLNVYSGNILEATISVTASITTPQSGFCSDGGAQTAALTGAIVGAFGPVGAVAASLFGTVSAACALSPSSS